MKPCGECSVCCSGALLGDAHGKKFGGEIKCEYLSQCNGCSIYDTRPDSCRNFFCLYTQEVIPNLQRPDKNGILVAVRDSADGQQFLEITKNSVYNQQQLELIQNWATQQGSYCVDLSDMPLKENSSEFEELCDLLRASGKGEAVKVLLDSLSEITKNTDSIIHLDSLAQQYFLSKYYNDAENIIEKMLDQKLEDDHQISILINFSNVLNHSNKPEKTLRVIQKLKELNFYTTKVAMEEAYAYFLLGEYHIAEKIINSIPSTFKLTHEDSVKVKFNSATYKLLNGNFKEGLRDFIKEGEKLYYWGISRSSRRNKGTNYGFGLVTEWDGQTVPNATIICYPDAGIGDEIINIRFLKEIESRGMKCVWVQNNPDRIDLASVFKRNGYGVLTSEEEVLEICKQPNVYYTLGMRLPHLLDLDAEQLWRGPYLSADRSYVEKWKEKTKTERKLKIGVRWKGMQDYDTDLHRSIPLNNLRDVLCVFDADIYSLQIDNFEEDIKWFPEIKNVAEQIETWEDTLGLIENLDIIVTSCTSVAHAAASMGKQVFVFVPISNYYVWANPTKKSPWYGDNVTILKQTKPRIWFDQMIELQTLMENYSYREVN